MKILKQPQAIFGFPIPDFEARKRFESYIVDVAGTINSNNWDQDLIDLIECIPQILLHIPNSVEIPQEMFKVLLYHPYVVFQSYLKEGNPQLEEVLKFSPEYCYYLLQRTRLPQAQRPYTPEPVLKDSMLNDPNWVIRWCIEQKDTGYYKTLQSYLKKTKEINAFSALADHRLHLDKMSREQALADVRAKMSKLLGEPRVAVWLAENYPELDRRPLYMNAIAGKPPYMLYWAERFPGEMDSFIKRDLLSHPAWLPDYFKMTNPSDAYEVWTKAYERCRNPWLASWMDVYAKSRGWA